MLQIVVYAYLMASVDIGKDLSVASLDQLLELLDQCGSKSLVVDKKVSPLLSSISPFSTLQKHGVSRVHWLEDELGPISGSVVYLSPGYPESIKSVANHASKCLKEPGSSHDLRLIVTPSKSNLVSWILTEAEVLGDVKVMEWSAYFGTILSNISLFLPQAGLENEDRMLFSTACALSRLQQSHGTISRISGFGKWSKRVHELILDQSGEMQAQFALEGGFDYTFGGAFVGSHVDHLILVDRQADWITPLLTQLTYAGLIDEAYHISSPGLITGHDGQKVQLNDDLFKQLSDLNFGSVGPTLNKVARQLQAEIDETHNAKSVAEIKDYVTKRLEAHKILKQNLKVHTSIAEDMLVQVKSSNFDLCLTLQQDLLNNQVSTWDAVVRIQELIYRGLSAQSVIRVMCLMCICRHGVREKYLHMLYDDVLRTYGYDYLPVLMSLEKRKLLFVKGEGTHFSSLSRSYNLCSEEPLAEPYAGYVPLSTRLVQNLISGSGASDFQGFEFFDTVQKSDNAREAKLRRILLRNTPGREEPVVLVLFIGGVTYSEAATLRLLEQVLDVPFKLVVGTTGMLNGRELSCNINM